MSPPATRVAPALACHARMPLYDRVVALTTRERHFKQALPGEARWQPGREVLDCRQPNARGTGSGPAPLHP